MLWDYKKIKSDVSLKNKNYFEKLNKTVPINHKPFHINQTHSKSTKNQILKKKGHVLVIQGTY